MDEWVRENWLYYDAQWYTSKVIAWADENYRDSLYVIVYDWYNFHLYGCVWYINSDSFEENWYDWANDDIKKLLDYIVADYTDVIDNSRYAISLLANIMYKRIPWTAWIYDDQIGWVVEDCSGLRTVIGNDTNSSSLDMANRIIEMVDFYDSTAEYSCNAEELKERIDKVKWLRNSNNNNIVVYKHN